MYSPTLGRFMQTDPIGFGGGMNLYAAMGGDPVNFTDPSGNQRICVRVPALVGRGDVEKCVYVDGDNDGVVNENDMNSGQIEAYRTDYRGAIAAIGGSPYNPTDISSYSKPVQGAANPWQQTMTSVASQFIGYFAAHATSSDNNVTTTRFRDAWNSLPYIRASNEPSHSAASELISIGAFTPWHRLGYIQIWASWIYGSPSDLARAMLHEPWHLIWQGRVNHDAIDLGARTMTVRLGLGRCRATGGFPAC
jgi:hypothetical protein